MRESKHIRFKHEGVCRSCSGDIKAGTFGWWAVASDIVWHSNCPTPAALAALPEESEEAERARFDAWCDKKICEDHERHNAAKAARATGGSANAEAVSVDGGTNGEKTPKADAPTPASVTSDTRFVEAF